MHELIGKHARRCGEATVVIAAFGYAVSLDPRWVAVGAAGWLAGRGIVGLVALYRAGRLVDAQRDLYYTDSIAHRSLDGPCGALAPWFDCLDRDEDARATGARARRRDQQHLTPGEQQAWAGAVRQLQDNEPLWEQAW